MDSQPRDGYYYFGDQTGQGVDAYVIDTGIRTSHSEFGGRASCPISFVPGEACVDQHYHGTHCAGIIGGRTYGVAKEVNLIGVKVLDNKGQGTVSRAVTGIDWATERYLSTGKRPSVMSMSLGSQSVSTSLNDAIASAVSAGIVFAAAAGNSNKTACSQSPGSSPDAIVVGAIDSSSRRTSWSNLGPCIDVFAPGENVYSAGHHSDTNRVRSSGTSMAAPHVAGVVALYMQSHPGATPDVVKAAVLADAATGVSNAGPGSPDRQIRIPQTAGGSQAPNITPKTGTGGQKKRCRRKRWKCRKDAQCCSKMCRYSWKRGRMQCVSVGRAKKIRAAAQRRKRTAANNNRRSSRNNNRRVAAVRRRGNL